MGVFTVICVYVNGKKVLWGLDLDVVVVRFVDERIKQIAKIEKGKGKGSNAVMVPGSQ